MDFKFYSHEQCVKMQNILLQHMHEKEFLILANKCGNKPQHENEAPGLVLENRATHAEEKWIRSNPPGRLK